MTTNREASAGNGKDPKIIAKLHESDKHIGLDLSGHILFGEIFRNKDFSKSSLESSDLSGCDLSGCIFLNTDLTDTNLEGAFLNNVEIVGAKRSGKKITGYASVAVNGKSYYAFEVQGASGKKIMINEPGVKEYEFKMVKKTMIGATLVNLLNMK